MSFTYKTMILNNYNFTFSRLRESGDFEKIVHAAKIFSECTSLFYRPGHTASSDFLKNKPVWDI